MVSNPFYCVISQKLHDFHQNEIIALINWRFDKLHLIDLLTCLLQKYFDSNGELFDIISKIINYFISNGFTPSYTWIQLFNEKKIVPSERTVTLFRLIVNECNLNIQPPLFWRQLWVETLFSSYIPFFAETIPIQKFPNWINPNVLIAEDILKLNNNQSINVWAMDEYLYGDPNWALATMCSVRKLQYDTFLITLYGFASFTCTQTQLLSSEYHLQLYGESPYNSFVLPKITPEVENAQNNQKKRLANCLDEVNKYVIDAIGQIIISYLPFCG